MLKKSMALLAAACCSLSFLTGTLTALAEEAAPEKVTVNDSETGWYTPTLRTRGATADIKDSVRQVKYSENFGPTEGENGIVDKVNDEDGVSIRWMTLLDDSNGVNPENYDMICKDLSVPVMGGTFAYKFFWNVSSEEELNAKKGKIRLSAVAYEMDGTAHQLTPSAYLPVHMWHEYSAELPADKVIHKLEIRLEKDSAAEDVRFELDSWNAVDHIRIENTQLMTDEVAVLAATGWKNIANDADAPTEPADWMSRDGGDFVKIEGAYAAKNDKHMIYKMLQSNVENGWLTFKVFNHVNSSVAGQPQFKAFAVAYEQDGAAHELAVLPADEAMGFAYSGNQVYQGMYCYRAQLPADVTVRKVAIGLQMVNDSNYDGAGFKVNDIKLVGTNLASEEGGGDGDGDGGDEPTVFPEFPVKTDFTPDTNPTGTDSYRDNELGWYNEDVQYDNSNLKDHVRIIHYDEGYTEADGWAWIKNHFIRYQTDNDLYALQMMAAVDHPVNNGRPYDIIYRDLPDPVKGGVLDFYFWYRNGFEYNHDVFQLEAYAFDAAGKAYALGETNPLPWSGDHVNEKAGWQHYSGALPKDVEIVKLGIKIFKADPDAAGILGPAYEGESFAEDWIAFDEITIQKTTVLDDGTYRDDETGWDSEDVNITEMGEYLHPTCILEGDTALELDCSFNYEGGSDTAVIFKEYDEAISAEKFIFSLYNTVDASVATQPKFQVDVYGYDEAGNRIKLGTYPKDAESFLKFSGSPTSFQTFYGWNRIEMALPEGKSFVKMEIAIRDTTGNESESALIFLDDIKFMGVKANVSGGGQEPGEENPGDKEPDTNPPETGVAAPFFLLALLPLSAVVLLASKQRELRKN